MIENVERPMAAETIENQTTRAYVVPQIGGAALELTDATQMLEELARKPKDVSRTVLRNETGTRPKRPIKKERWFF